MNTKLTLRLDKSVINKAKAYAASRDISLSRMIESYLRSLLVEDLSESKKKVKISPFVKSMSTGVKISPDIDPKELYKDSLTEKYLDG